MPLTKNKTLTYLIKSVKITDLWDAEIEVAELDGATELRRVTVTASPAECAPLLGALVTPGKTAKETMGAIAYNIVQTKLGL
jgi:hypothetical protein